MTGSRVNSWALSIAGDVPPPLQIPQPSREVHKHPNAHDQVNVSIPPFNGRFKPALYIEWEFDIKNIFASHNFNEHKNDKVAILRAFVKKNKSYIENKFVSTDFFDSNKF